MLVLQVLKDPKLLTPGLFDSVLMDTSKTVQVFPYGWHILSTIQSTCLNEFKDLSHIIPLWLLDDSMSETSTEKYRPGKGGHIKAL